MMRLIHFIHTPRHSGAEMLVYNLCKLHRESGHECAIASFAPPQQEFIHLAHDLEQRGVKLFFPALPKKKMGRIGYYRNALRSFQADIIFAHSELPSLYGRFAKGYGGRSTRFVSVMHSATINDFSSGPIAVAERLTRFRLDQVVAVSDSAKANYTEIYGGMIPVTTISNGIDVNSYRKVDRNYVRQELGLRDDERIALQVGRISDVKQQLWTLSTLKPLLTAGSLKLWFAGLTEDNRYEAKLRQAITDWDLQGAVKLLGSRSDVPKLLAAADIYLMPSKREAHSVAMLEALASGVLIFASNIPAFEFAKEFPGVFLFDVDGTEAPIHLIADAVSYTKKVDRDLSDYSINKTAGAYLALAKDLVTRGNKDDYRWQ